MIGFSHTSVSTDESAHLTHQMSLALNWRYLRGDGCGSAPTGPRAVAHRALSSSNHCCATRCRRYLCERGVAAAAAAPGAGAGDRQAYHAIGLGFDELNARHFVVSRLAHLRHRPRFQHRRPSRGCLRPGAQSVLATAGMPPWRGEAGD